MGIADRDWYQDELRKRESRPNPFVNEQAAFRPPNEGALWLASWVMVFVVAVAGSLGIHNWWKAKHTAPASRKDASAPIVVPPQRQAAPQGIEPAPFVEPGSSETRVVSRCVVNGTVTYTGAGRCSTSSASVLVRPSESQLEGGLTPYQVDMLRSADARIARDEAAARVSAPSSTTTLNRQSECSALDEQIRGLDARSRHLVSGSEQDYIRGERMRARSRQFELHC